MRKTVKKYFIALTLALTLACTVSAVAGCKKDKPTSSPDTSIESSVEQATTYLLSFETNGGTPVASVKVEEGATVSLKDFVTTKSGMYFYGWALDEAFQNRASATITITENTKLYAQWGAEEKYALHFVTNGGTEMQSVMYRPNDYLSEPEAPTKPFHTFAGWYKDAACTEEVSFYTFPQMPKGELTLYAKWIPTNGIIFETNGGTAIEMVTGAMGDPITVEEPTKTDYIFEGWYTDRACTKPYDVVMIPNGLVTVYAKWHEQQKDISITLHINYGGMETTATVKGNEGEDVSAKNELSAFTTAVNDSVKDAYVGNASDLTDKPIFKFSQWAFDATGNQRFDGELPHTQDGTLDLYAVWSRTATYCEITFAEKDVETSYYIQKNSVLSDEIFDRHSAQAKAEYEAKGCAVEGFYTAGGNRYEKGATIAMDMRLIPYVYSPDLAYTYMKDVPTGTGASLTGYALTGYTKDEYKDKDNLLLLVPDFYNDGTHGQLPIVWIGDNAFQDYNVSEITIPDSVMGIGKQAFMNTALTSINLPEKLYYIGDNAFTGSEGLETVTFQGDVSQLGATVFKNTVYETKMPRNEGFIFFDGAKSIIYGYEGTAEEVTTPSTARTVAGGAFKDNATIKRLTLNNSIRFVGDYAFEGSALESVTLGKFFSSMGTGIFKDCTALTSVSFVSQYNLAQIGVSMFEGCTSLKYIDLLQIASLKTIAQRAFYGCTSLESLAFSDTFLQVQDSAFENCTSLISVSFGETDASEFASIGNRVFAGCSALRSVVLRGELPNNYTTVTFGTEVFNGANPVVYVKHMYVDNWGNSEEFEDQNTYVEIYRAYLNKRGYTAIEVKAIDNVPVVTVNGMLTVSASAGLASFDLLAFILSENVLVVEDETAQADCRFYIQTVKVVDQQGQQGNEIFPVNGKYNLSKGVAFDAIVAVEDECCNKATATVRIIVQN